MQRNLHISIYSWDNDCSIPQLCLQAWDTREAQFISTELFYPHNPQTLIIIKSLLLWEKLKPHLSSPAATFTVVVMCITFIFILWEICWKVRYYLLNQIQWSLGRGRSCTGSHGNGLHLKLLLVTECKSTSGGLNLFIISSRRVFCLPDKKSQY